MMHSHQTTNGLAAYGLTAAASLLIILAFALVYVEIKKRRRATSTIENNELQMDLKLGYTIMPALIGFVTLFGIMLFSAMP